MLKTDAILSLLKLRTHDDLSSLYNHNMEVQVNVARDNGERVRMGEFKGKEWNAFTDGFETWKPIRIPINAKSNPEYTDGPINFSLDKHAEAIGMTGWDWVNKVSKWVAFDFDAILGHSDRHSKKLSVEELAQIQTVVENVPYVTVRRSTSGKGLHIYIFLEDVPTVNHTEHAALARAILSMLSGMTGYDFSGKVDVCGGNMWIWHRKMTVENEGLKLLKKGETLKHVPQNWRDHVNIVAHRSKRALPSFVAEDAAFEELMGQSNRSTLDCEHKALIEWLSSNNCVWWWDQDNRMLVTHTYHLKEAMEPLHVRGKFETLATGSERGHDHNVFCFPMRNGAWSVRRFSIGCKEADTWLQDGQGWTTCYYNRDPDLKLLARLNNGIESEKGSFVFRDASALQKVIIGLGINCELPNFVMSRQASIKHNTRDNKIIAKIEWHQNDDGTKMKEWLLEKKQWVHVFRGTNNTNVEVAEIRQNFDDVIRHIISTSEQDAGWVLKKDTSWIDEPLNHIKPVMAALGNDPKDITTIIGASILKAWTLVNKPFEPEYPGNREWNRNSVQFAIVPSTDVDDLSYPTWNRILKHCGQGIDDAVSRDAWCQSVGIQNGSEYLTLWIATLLRKPHLPMTYLALWGPQNSGKSIIHEAVSEILITRGCVRADQALQNQSNFNSELENAILCVVEETDLKKNKIAYNRIKDWVTSPNIMIHRKGNEPYMMNNTTHFIQCANDAESCPIFPGDTRITLIYVPELTKEQLIPKPQLMQMLRKEAPDFLAAILNMELPTSEDRLAVPTISTDAKIRASEKNMSLLEQFIKECCKECDGHFIKSIDFHSRFQEWLDPSDKSYWTRQRTGRELPERIVKGRLGSSVETHYGNITFDMDATPGRRFIVAGIVIKQESIAIPEHHNAVSNV